MKIPVIIMAGGKGERLGELTKDIPKPMVEVAGKPYLEHLIMQLIDNGLDEFIISAGYKAEVIINYIKELNQRLNLNKPIQVIVEPKRLGSGGGVKYVMVEANVDKALVVNGDVFIEGDISEVVKAHLLTNGQSNDITMGITLVDNVGQFGEVFTEGDRVIEIKEKTGREGSGWINAGVYAVNKALLDNEDEYFEFWQLIQKTLNDKTKKVGYVKFTGKFIDIGTKEKLAKIRLYMQKIS
jgi:NDP-sugar pyrophosphorylase family protein